jgi:hypothetical protein
MTHKLECYSAGIGLAIGAASIDVAYQHLVQSQTAFYLFYAMDDQGYMDSASQLYETKQLRDYVTLSLSFRF